MKPTTLRKPQRADVSETTAGDLEKVVLQQIAESLQQTNKALHDLNASVQAMAIKVNTLETHDLAAKYELLRKDVDALKLKEAEESGATKLLKWLVNQIPWIVTLGVAAAGWWYNTHIKSGSK